MMQFWSGLVLLSYSFTTVSSTTKWPSTGSFGILPHLPYPQYLRMMKTDEALLDIFSTSSKEWKPEAPEIKSLKILSTISNRYANTLITSRVVNPANISQELTFTVIIPETAFISGFVMEIDGKVYRAYVKEKEQAKREYANAVNRGQAAAHVQQSVRDSERFSMSVNIEAQSKVTFNLTYEELLQRELGTYRHVINLNPGQIVPEMSVDVHIKETKNLTDVRATELQSGNEINPDVGDNPKAQVELINANEAKIHFEADEKEQKRLEKMKKNGGDVKGVSGQFVIEYDVVRDPSGGEVIVNDGYFVHFFAPNNLLPLKKHVLFVLDTSGSMSGRKIEQLKQAMSTILDELHPQDFFNIIEFSYSVTVRNLDGEVNSAVYQPFYYLHAPYSSDEVPVPATVQNTKPFPADPHYIKKAKDTIEKMTAGGGTNIHDALKCAIEIAKRGVPVSSESKLVSDIRTDKADTNEQLFPTSENPTKGKDDKEQSLVRNDIKAQPIIIFLTDGEPTVGETRLHKIQSAVNKFNSDSKAPIFSLAFGDEADFPFLKKVSLANSAFSRRIYEAADAAKQLKNFYNQISSPLLANVRFVYPAGQVDYQTVTKRVFSNLFEGSEIVIAGKVLQQLQSSEIEAESFNGSRKFIVQAPEILKREQSLGSLERLWAYIRVRDLLNEEEVASANTPQYSPDPDTVSNTSGSVGSSELTPKEKALQIALQKCFDGVKSIFGNLLDWIVMGLKVIHTLLSDPFELVYVDSVTLQRVVRTPRDRAIKLALKYSFVCPLTSLVVIKPNETSDLNTESAIPGAEDGPAALPFQHASPMLRNKVMMAAMSKGPASSSNRPSGGTTSDFADKLSAPPLMMTTFPMMASNRLSFDGTSFRSAGFSHSAAVQPLLTTLNVPTSFDRVDIDAEVEIDISSTPAPDVDQLYGVEWIDAVRQGDYIVLNTTNGTTSLLLTIPANVTDNIPCVIDAQEGVCRPLTLSLTEDIVRASVEDYIAKFMCHLPGNYAGVCRRSSDVLTTTATPEMTREDDIQAVTTVETTVPTEQIEISTGEAITQKIQETSTAAIIANPEQNGNVTTIRDN